MSIASEKDLIGMKNAGKAVAITLKKMREFAKPGMSTKTLDDYGFSVLNAFGAISAPMKDYNFPGFTCISINHEACHGIPSHHRILQEGDLVNIDVSAELDGYYADNGGSFILGKDEQGLDPLVQASKEILEEAIGKITDRVRISEVGGFIHQAAKKRGFTVVKNLCGHGVGRKLHEAPFEIPCFRDRLNRERFRKNSVIALETFISTKANLVYEMADGWTMRPKDNSFVAQHEHTLIVTDSEPIIVTAANEIF
ncbi:MAG: type I methionyl aminopeptidase [Saprospiraceae bacterium]|nr:type I methionyl aminopeptidase [Saprospiraceae bacterium]